MPSPGLSSLPSYIAWTVPASPRKLSLKFLEVKKFQSRAAVASRMILSAKLVLSEDGAASGAAVAVSVCSASLRDFDAGRKLPVL